MPKKKFKLYLDFFLVLLNFDQCKKNDKFDNVSISLTSLKFLCISEQYWKRVHLKTDRSGLKFLVQCRLTDLTQYIAVHQFELNALIKACSVGVSV